MIKKTYLLTPGPTPVPEKILSLASQPLFHHRTPEFSALFQEMSENLKILFCTKQDVYCLTASGSGAMEAAVSNITSVGDRVLVINAGKFGERWAQIARTWGAEVIEEKIAWGADYPKERLEDALKKSGDVRIVFSTLSETSSGALYDIEGFAQTVRGTGALLVVDGISGLGATPCPMDAWGIDVLIGSSQKALMAPPGLSYIALSPKAWKKTEANPAPRFYFDLRKYRQNLTKQTTPFSPAISLVIQQSEALRWIRSMTLEELIHHHRILAEATRAAVRALDLELLAKKPGNSLTAISIPSGIDGNQLVKTLQSKYMTHVANAQEPHKGEFMRIGHLGYIGAFDIVVAISALEMALREAGHSARPGSGVAEAEKIFSEAWT